MPRAAVKTNCKFLHNYCSSWTFDILKFELLYLICSMNKKNKKNHQNVRRPFLTFDVPLCNWTVEMVTRLYTQFERLPSSIIFNNFIADYSKQVKQRVSERFLFIHNLEEEITYTFSVRAQTIDYGPPVIGNVTTGPQSGSPGRPRDLVLSKTISAIKLSWTNSNSGRGPILGYYIESRRKGIIHFLC